MRGEARGARRERARNGTERVREGDRESAGVRKGAKALTRYRRCVSAQAAAVSLAGLAATINFTSLAAAVFDRGSDKEPGLQCADREARRHRLNGLEYLLG